jgi:hypothetical protein
VQELLSSLWLSTSPLLYLHNCRTDPNENTNNEEVFSFWSVLRLLLGNNNSEVACTLNGRNITFVNNVKHLGVIFDKITWRLHIEMIEAKAFRTVIRVYSLFMSNA